MRHASLFTGIGGFDLAAQRMGWENVFQVEIDPFCQKVLEKNFPNVTRYGNIKQFDGTKYRGAIDVLTGGFPCQPFSSAGKRKGNDDNRYLWPEMFRVIREIQPAIIVGENVYGILNWSKGLVFEQVCADLENEGYEVQPVILPACSVNAPHKRDRVWFIAYSESNGNNRRSRNIPIKDGGSMRNDIPESNSSDTFFISRRMDWIIDKEGTSIEPLFCRTNDGVPKRLDQDRRESLGNAIVWKVAFEIFKAIELCQNASTVDQTR